MRFDPKQGKYVDTPQPGLGPVEKALSKAQTSSLGGPGAAGAVAAVAAIGIDAGLKGGSALAERLAAIFKKKGGK